MAFMKRCKIELLSAGLALAVLALFAERAPQLSLRDSEQLSAEQAIAESALYLDGDVCSARFHRDVGRWQVSDGEDVAWLDGHTGELVELELGSAR